MQPGEQQQLSGSLKLPLDARNKSGHDELSESLPPYAFSLKYFTALPAQILSRSIVGMSL